MLVRALEELQRLLRGAGSRWADELGGVIAEVQGGRAEGARRFLRMHGGMGSLNDEWLSGSDAEQTKLLNSRRDQLDERAYAIAEALLREHDRAL